MDKFGQNIFFRVSEGAILTVLTLVKVEGVEGAKFGFIFFWLDLLILIEI